ncbi:hypothetical protein AB0942_34985 [Streptomyces nodosus]|uniref:hypothetical protein n=1 Tax=Streptomyces nodosus TaxID=40318 RepID=UPI0034554F27
MRERLGEAAAHVPATEPPGEAVHQAAQTGPALKGLLPSLGKIRHAGKGSARTLLGRTPRSSDEAVTATAGSLADTRPAARIRPAADATSCTPPPAPRERRVCPATRACPAAGLASSADPNGSRAQGRSFDHP